MSYSGDMEGCHARARTDGRRTTEHEDRARILEAEFAIRQTLDKLNTTKKASPPSAPLTMGYTPPFQQHAEMRPRS